MDNSTISKQKKIRIRYVTELAKKFDYTFLDNKSDFERNNRETKILSTFNDFEKSMKM